MMMEPDTYFLSSDEALRVATQHNRSDDINQYELQICYYNGEKIDSDLINLVHAPIENIVSILALGTYRLPSKLSFDGMNLSEDVVEEITHHFNFALAEAKLARKALNEHYLQELLKSKLDFTQGLRIYTSYSTQTRVMRYVLQNIADEFIQRGFEVLVHINYGMNDRYCHKVLKEFNPHVTININNLNNKFIGEDVFNFVWFQDFMPILTNNENIYLRKRDFIYSLLPDFDILLENKNIPYERQGFCVNTELYKKNDKTKRKKKIVFIGSSYLDSLGNDKLIRNAVLKLEQIFLNGDDLNKEVAKEIAKRFNLNIDFVTLRLIPYIIRDIGLLQLCKLKTDYEIEIYGWGWERYAEMKPYYRGVLTYGKEIADVYSSATFAFAPHHQYTLQQRVFEASSCGAIPIVYDCRNTSQEDDYEEALCYYNTTADLKKILNASIQKKDFTRLLESHTYRDFAQIMLNTLKDNL